MPEGDATDLDAKAAYAQLLAIADHARQVRKKDETCTALEVDYVLGAYEALRTLCQELTCGERTVVSLADLGRIAGGKQYGAGELRAMLTRVEVECFKGVGALASIIALTANEGSPPE